MTGTGATVRDDGTPEDHAGRDDAVATLRRAASWLHRDRFVPVTGWSQAAVGAHDGAAPACEAHGVPHTGKLARSIVIDLAVHDALGTGHPDAEASWGRAVARALWVISRLGPDPGHGALIFLPGRLDARNASTSLIDAGECVDALATLARHPRFAGLAERDRASTLQAIRDCADTYLAATVGTKAVVNQVLWGAMGLAHACAAFPGEGAWREAVARAVGLAVDRQRDDGSWGYEEPSSHAHPGAADMTVYYHGRCLAFLRAILDHVPEADADGRAGEAWRRGIDLLRAVRAPDGTKSLALEGKRWFWTSAQEAGSHAYDAYVLARVGDAGTREAAVASWRTLRARIDDAGAVRAGDGAWPLGDAADLVCRDFHVADLAWVARAVPYLWGGAREDEAGERGACPPPHTWGVSPPLPGRVASPPLPGRVATTPTPRSEGKPPTPRGSGVVRLEAGGGLAILRVAKAPCNAQWGGAIGGGTVVATRAGASAWLDGAMTPGSIAFRPAGAGVVARAVTAFAGARRWLAANRPGREGRQVAFTLRVLARSAISHARAGHFRAATRIAAGTVLQAWRGIATPFVEALDDVATTHWATSMVEEAPGDGRARAGRDARGPEGGGTIAAWSGAVVPSRRDGTVPSWARGARVVRQVRVDASGVLVVDRVEVAQPVAGVPGGTVAVAVAIPPGASGVRVRLGDGAVVAGGDLEREGRDGSGFPSLVPGSGTGAGVLRWEANSPRSGGGVRPEEPGRAWRVWLGGATARARVRPRPGATPRPGTPGTSAGWSSAGGTNDGTLEVAYRLDG